MGLFNFFKQKEEDKFVGRHQQICAIKIFLGQKIPDLELQIAINRDNLERGELVEEIEEIEKYIDSDLFNRFTVENINAKVRDLIDKGHKTCVLINDPNLEERCFKIFDDTDEYLSSLVEDKDKKEELIRLSKQIKSFFALGVLLNRISLGGLLNKESDDKQKAWFIINSIIYPNKLIEHALSILGSEPALGQAEGLKAIANKLLNENTINNNDMRKINTEIENGLLLSQKN